MAYIFWMPNDTFRVTFDTDNFQSEIKVIDGFKLIPSKHRKYDGTTYFWSFTSEHREDVLGLFAAAKCWVLEVTPDVIALWRGSPHELIVIPPQAINTDGSMITPSARTVYDKCINAIIVQGKPGRRVIFLLREWIDYGAFVDARDGKTQPTERPKAPPSPAVQLEKRTGELSIAWIGKYLKGVAPFSLMRAPRKAIGRMPDYVMQIWGREQQNREMSEMQMVAALNITSHYHTLGFGLFDARAAQTDEVKKRYYTLAKRYHPDQNRAPNAGEMFRALSTAKDFFLDAITDKADMGALSKAIYDTRIRGQVLRGLITKGIAPATVIDAEHALKIHYGVFACDYEEGEIDEQPIIWVSAVHDVQLLYIGGQVYAPSSMHEAMKLWAANKTLLA